MRIPMIPVALCAVAALAVAQERVKPKTPADFKATLAAASKAWDNQKYGGCLEHLRTLTALVSVKRREAVLAALPGAPKGFEIVPEKKNQNAAANPYLAGMTAMVGTSIERKYRETEGRATVNVTVTADSPMITMFSAYAANPAMLGENGELIKYGTHTAVLKTESAGKQYSLQILVNAKHLCDVKVRGRDDEFVLRLFNQGVVDKLAAVLAN